MIRLGPLAFDGVVTDLTVGRDQVVISGAVDLGNREVALAFAEQVTALAALEDEPIVPLIVEGGWAGFATVSAAEVTPMLWDSGILRFRIVATPIERPAHPQITSGITARVRVNDHNLLFSAPFFAVPADVEMWTWQPTGTAVTETRPTAPGPAVGDVLYRRVTAGTGQSTAHWVCPPDAWYQGCCHAEQYVADRWMPVVGRGLLGQPWRISNGLVEVTLIEGGLSTGRMSLRWWRPDQPDEGDEGEVDRWTPAQEFGVGLGGGIDVTAWHSAEIVEQSPQRLKLRVQAVRTAGRLTMWITIRRGSRLVDCTVDTDVTPGHRVRILPADAVELAAVAGAGEGDEGWHAALVDPVPGSGEDGPGGMRWVFCARDNFDVDLTDGIFTPENTLASQWTWGISAWFENADDDTGDQIQTARDWFCAQAEQVTIR